MSASNSSPETRSKSGLGFCRQLSQLESSANYQEARLLFVTLGFIGVLFVWPIFYHVIGTPSAFHEGVYFDGNAAARIAVDELFAAPRVWFWFFIGSFTYGIALYALVTAGMWRRLWRTYAHLRHVIKTQRLIDRIDEPNYPSFSLYLRPFSIDALTREVERTVATFGHTTVALGDPFIENFADKHIARIWADDSEWQPLVRSMLERAKVVVVHPSAQEGTRWEMLHIVSSPEIRARTKMVVPPARNYELVRHYLAARELFEGQDRWPEPAEEVAVVSLVPHS